MTSYDTVTEALAGLKARGYSVDFNLAFDRVICKETGIFLYPSISRLPNFIALRETPIPAMKIPCMHSSRKMEISKAHWSLPMALTAKTWIPICFANFPCTLINNGLSAGVDFSYPMAKVS